MPDTETPDESKMQEGQPLKRKKRLTPSSKDYLNNEMFTKQVAEWVEGNKNGNYMAISTELAESFTKLINNYAKRRWFSGYSYLDDMKSEAFLRCLKYGHNFNIEKSNNAFSYFTQVIHNTFRKIIESERTQMKIKYDGISELNNTGLNYKNIKLESSEDYDGVC